MFIYESHSTILFLKNLSMAFELKDLVLLTYFRGLQIKYTPYGFFVHVNISFYTPYDSSFYSPMLIILEGSKTDIGSS